MIVLTLSMKRLTHDRKKRATIPPKMMSPIEIITTIPKEVKSKMNQTIINYHSHLNGQFHWIPIHDSLLEKVSLMTNIFFHIKRFVYYKKFMKS